MGPDWGGTELRGAFLVPGAEVPLGGQSCVSMENDYNLIVKQPELLGDEVEGKLVSFSRWAQDSKVDLMRTCLV